MPQNGDVSDDDNVREPSGRVPGPLDRRWLWLAIAGGAVLTVAVVAGAASLWESEPELQARSAGDRPAREYGGPVWFTAGAADETQLVTNSLPRGVAGPGTATVGTARYLADQKCFTDGNRLLVWPRGSRPLSIDGRPGVSPGDDVQILDGESFRAIGEELTIVDTEGFPEIDPACAPGGLALSLSAVEAG